MGHPFKYIFIDVEPTAYGCGVLSHYVPECKTRGPYTVPPNLHRNVEGWTELCSDKPGAQPGNASCSSLAATFTLAVPVLAVNDYFADIVWSTFVLAARCLLEAIS